MVRWIGIPLAVIVPIILLLGGVFGIKELADVTKAKNEIEKTSAVLKSSYESLHMLLSRTIKLEAEALLDMYPLDSGATDYVARVHGLKSLVGALETLQQQYGRRAEEDELRVARGLIAYKREDYPEVIRALGDPPTQEGIWQRHLLAAAYYRLGDKKKNIQHTEKMVELARNRGSIAARAEQNLAASYGADGRIEEAIKRMGESLRRENRPVGRANLAGLLAKRGKPGDLERAFKELDEAFALGLCLSFDVLEKDPEIGILVKHKDYRARVENLVSRRGAC